MENLQTIDERLQNIESLLLSQKTVLNFDEVAIYTGLSKSYLYKLSSTGGIPCYKPRAKQLYFDKVEIDKWLLRNRIKTNDEIEIEAATHVTLNM
ncbi:MAG: DNA-binding protein [Bacteroidetes bacterium]|nr:MAG: DNA-binding protein [Bacteroidota bacterium]